MIRFLKALALISGSSVIVLQTPCTFAQHGFTILPNIPNPFNFLGNLIP